jgi:hypothetical protein
MVEVHELDWAVQIFKAAGLKEILTENQNPYSIGRTKTNMKRQLTLAGCLLSLTFVSRASAADSKSIDVESCGRDVEFRPGGACAS